MVFTDLSHVAIERYAESDAKNEERTTSERSALESSPVRQRPFLPRNAKDRVNYTHISIAVLTIRCTTSSIAREPLAHSRNYGKLLSIACSQRGQSAGVVCIKGGAHIKGLCHVNAVEICENNHWFEINQPNTDFKVRFPDKVILHNYRVTKQSLNGSTAKSQRWVCPLVHFVSKLQPLHFNGIQSKTSNLHHSIALIRRHYEFVFPYRGVKEIN